MKWYVINKEYVKYLKQFDKFVENIDYGENLKPYIGIIFQFNNFDYYVPISSVKEKHYLMRENIDFIKIQDNGKILGVLNLNNMIPILGKDKQLLNYNKIDKFTTFKTQLDKFNYIGLLQKELNIINNNSNKIKKYAEKIYRYKYTFPNTSISKRTIDFKLLEEKCIEWNTVQAVQPALKHIKTKEDLFFIYDNLDDKSNFEKVVKILDKKEFCDNIKNMNIKDLENKKVPSIDEISSFVYEKLKDKYTVTFLDVLDDVNLLFGCDETLVSKTNEEGKIVVPFTEKEIEELKNFTLKNIKEILEANSLETDNEAEDEDEL